MDEISVEGKKYLKAKLVARELGYTNDYVGQLCRAGKVDAKLVGRTWYVDPTTVKGHKQTRYRSTKATTHRDLRSSVAKILVEQPVEKEHFYDHRAATKTSAPVHYEADETDLLPSPKKPVSLPVELAEAQKLHVDDSPTEKYRFETPKREETKFFGTLKVTDFITEVSVQGESEAEPEPVTVTGAKKKGETEPKLKSKEDHYKAYKIDINTVTSTSSPLKKLVPSTKVIPVAVDSEEVTLPLIYHFVMISAFFLGLTTAALLVGLQSDITATKDTLYQSYVFAVENLSALIYLIK